MNRMKEIKVQVYLSTHHRESMNLLSSPSNLNGITNIRVYFALRCRSPYGSMALDVASKVLWFCIAGYSDLTIPNQMIIPSIPLELARVSRVRLSLLQSSRA